MRASLGMYDRAETAGANDRFWALLRDRLAARGVSAPATLTRGEAAFWPTWTAKDLVLSQTCGYPFRARLHGAVTLIGTADHRLADCAPGFYNSVLVVRQDDARTAVQDYADARFAFNEALSQSGWAAPQTHSKGLGFRFRPSLCTGAHRLSALAVAEGRADIAAIDAVSYRMFQRHDPFMAGLREIGRTSPTPALPFIAGPGADTSAHYGALSDAVAALDAADAAELSLFGVVRIAAGEYLAVPTPPSPEQIVQEP